MHGGMRYEQYAQVGGGKMAMYMDIHPTLPSGETVCVSAQSLTVIASGQSTALNFTMLWPRAQCLAMPIQAYTMLS